MYQVGEASSTKWVWGLSWWYSQNSSQNTWLGGVGLLAMTGRNSCKAFCPGEPTSGWRSRSGNLALGKALNNDNEPVERERAGGGGESQGSEEPITWGSCGGLSSQQCLSSHIYQVTASEKTQVDLVLLCHVVASFFLFNNWGKNCGAKHSAYIKCTIFVIRKSTISWCLIYSRCWATNLQNFLFSKMEPLYPWINSPRFLPPSPCQQPLYFLFLWVWLR